ncbi:MAG: hypothetical protein BGO97_03195 [Micrococcales bacterium 70-64]|nr:DUF1801 domain-containing protein [Leifsonia sp.]ODU63127.1 MAG: hypothetical protein ABT06_03200 [Leifsonia sp. SCN 70-46]OJX84818.1 MAG: hypothetical protein BGO97_03195 [Micrococcales bacterium 70-64]
MEPVEQYIAQFPDEVQGILRQVRAAILAEAPGAEERVRYGMPAVMLGGRYALHYAAWKKHVGIYPVATAPEPLESELAPFRAAKDSINFPYSTPIPYDLVGRIAAFVRERAAS